MRRSLLLLMQHPLLSVVRKTLQKRRPRSGPLPEGGEVGPGLNDPVRPDLLLVVEGAKEAVAPFGLERRIRISDATTCQDIERRTILECRQHRGCRKKEKNIFLL